MDFDQVARIIGDVPHIPPDRGRLLYDFVRETKPSAALELGFAHGTSACYIAAALRANGNGRLLTIDNRTAREREPNIFTLLERTGLSAHVEPIFAARSYTWELMKLIEANTSGGRTTPQFDFVFIDGAHTWDADGFAFYLADRLLRPGGWILFDDVAWTPDLMAGEAWLESLAPEEHHVAHIEKVVSLLVVPDGRFEIVRFDGTWAWVRKKASAEDPDDRSRVVREIYSRTARTRMAITCRRYLKRLLRIH
jgi:predicted O-methyltransferase YrrM